MIIKPQFKNFICTTSNPLGCQKNIKENISYIKNLYKNEIYPKKNILIIGSSTGYGLITRLTAIFGCKANTIGVFKEKQATKNKTATAGWYNTAYLEDEAKKLDLYTKSINNSAFSFETKEEVCNNIKNNLKKIDILIYSLATSKRLDPVSNITYLSTIKPIKDPFTSKSINITKNEITTNIIQKANKEEILNTIKVMGGDDWTLWIDVLLKNNLLNKNFKTIAYSYDGPSLTYPIYKYGTIGLAKKHLAKTACDINKKTEKINGHAFISINEAIITQSSMAIPSVPLYLAILNTTKTNLNIKENSVDHIKKLLSKIYNLKEKNKIIRLDSTELRHDIQKNIKHIWENITTQNIKNYINTQNLQNDFLKIHGFDNSIITQTQNHIININSIN